LPVSLATLTASSSDRYHKDALPDLLTRHVGGGGRLQPLNTFVVGADNVGVRLVVHVGGQITAHH
jgi:hypothetical protein